MGRDSTFLIPPVTTADQFHFEVTVGQSTMAGHYRNEFLLVRATQTLMQVCQDDREPRSWIPMTKQETHSQAFGTVSSKLMAWLEMGNWVFQVSFFNLPENGGL